MKDAGLFTVEVELSDVVLSGTGKAGCLPNLDSSCLLHV